MRIFFLATCLFFTFSATAQPGSSTVKWLTHTDSLYSLTIQYPSDWQLKPPTERARFFITSYPESDTDKFRDNLNCIVPKPVEKSVTIQMAEADIIKTLSESLPDFKLIRSSNPQWNNVSSYEIEYSCSQTRDNYTYYLHMLQRITIVNGMLYALTFTSEDEFYKKNIGTVNKMMGSFKVK